MTSEPVLPSDDSVSERTGMFGKIIGAMNALGTVWIIGLMLLINADIFGRTALNAPIAGVAELVAFSIVGIVFLQLAHTLKSGSMTRSDVLLNVLERRSPTIRRGLLSFFHLIGAGLLAVIAWRFWPSLEQAWLFPERHFMGNPGFFTVPHWPLFGLMLAGIITTSLQFLIEAADYARGAAGGHA